MPQSPLIRKLRIQPGQRLLILNPPPGYVESLAPLPEGAQFVPATAEEVDFCHLFAANSAQLAELLPTALAACKYDGLLWISYPKKSAKVDSDLSRDALWELPGDPGLRPVTQVSIDQTWSALRPRWHRGLRYRPAERVGKK
jgi:hypothetical protein